MIIFRNFLKKVLHNISLLAIKKHEIGFIVVSGWYGTDIVKEGIYEMLHDHLSIRRNIHPIWWDLSIPLNILGYEDKQYGFFGWIEIIFKSLIAIVVNKKNKHKIIIDISLADDNTAEYWSGLVSPEILVINSYKERQSLMIHSLVRRTRMNGGKILVASKIEVPDLERYESYDYKFEPQYTIITPQNNYVVSRMLPSVFLEVYAPVVAVTEKYGISSEYIKANLVKSEGLSLLPRRIKEKLLNN